MPHILKLACVVTLSLSLWGCSAKDDASQPVATSEVETAPETQRPKPAAKPKNAMGFDAALSLRENLEGKNRFVVLTRAMKGLTTRRAGATELTRNVWSPKTSLIRASCGIG